MLFMLLHVFLAILILLLNSSDAVVRRIQVEHHAFDTVNGPSLKLDLPEFDKELLQANGNLPDPLDTSKQFILLDTSVLSKGIKGRLRTTGIDMNNPLIANITVGSPPQNLTAIVDFWGYSYFYVVSPKAARLNAIKTIETYNGSASSTFVNSTTNFTTSFNSYHKNYGQFGEDVVNLGGVTLKNAKLAVLNYFTFNRLFEKHAIDAIVGLQPSYHNNTFASSIASQLDKPIISYWNRLRKGPIMLGAEDSLYCKSDSWVYADRASNHTYTVHFSSVSASHANGSTLGSAKTNGTLRVNPNTWYSSASGPMFNLIANATNAKWNQTMYRFVVNCSQVYNGGSLTLNIGKDGEAEKKVVVRGSDIIGKTKNICFLTVYNYSYHTGYFLYVGQGFLGNHCLAKNIVAKQYGFASIKVQQPAIGYIYK
jgi:hypothetical protein